MKTRLTIFHLLTFVSVFFTTRMFGWGNDVVISQAPESQHSIAAKQSGILYAGIPTIVLPFVYGTVLMISNDDGATWSFHPVIAPTSGNPVIRTKMVVTSLDSIICVIQQDNILYFVNVESGITGQFNTTGVQDFDVAAGAGNFIYIYVQEPNLNTIKRYGTGDGGITWTGNSATVTTQGSRPRISMSGTRLILNYYGPVQPDTTSSIIRAAFYNESAPGTLAAGTFQDVVTNTAVKKKQFQTVLNNGIAWLVYTEGDLQQVIKCRVSTDNGATYQPEFIISGNANVNAHWFGAASIINTGSVGITLTWLVDSIAGTTTYDKMYFATANDLQPSTFVIPASPFDTYNDFEATPLSPPATPVIVNYFSGTSKTGIAWTGTDSSQINLYFDRYDATTGINSIKENPSLTVYPSPAKDIITVSGEFKNKGKSEIEILSPEGKLISFVPIQLTSQTTFTSQIDISSFPAGIYLLRIKTADEILFRKFSVVK